MRHAAIGASLLLLSISAGHAQPGPGVRQDRREVRQDAREIRQDGRQLNDDVRDARRMEVLLQAFDAARATRQPARIVEVDRRVQAAIEVELRESGRELAQKQGEAARSGREVGQERREVGRDIAAGRPGRAAGDVRDLRDDRRDARDDRRDVRQEAVSANRLQGIQREYNALAGRLDPRSVDRRRALIAELVQMQRHEAAGDVREQREDRRELHEDRRERREDRRPGR
jgi:hypothetical protein